MTDANDPILLALERLHAELQAHNKGVNARLDRIEQDLASLRRLIRDSGEGGERKMIEVATGFANNISDLRGEQLAQTRKLDQVLLRITPPAREQPPYSTPADDRDRL